MKQFTRKLYHLFGVCFVITQQQRNPSIIRQFMWPTGSTDATGQSATMSSKSLPFELQLTNAITEAPFIMAYSRI